MNDVPENPMVAGRSVDRGIRRLGNRLPWRAFACRVMLLCFGVASLGGPLLSGCSENIAGGGSTETGNTIAGVVAVEGRNAHVNNVDMENIRIRLLKVNHAPTRTPQGYAVIPLAEAKVEEDGTFQLHPVPSGLYNLEVLDTLTHFSVLVDSLVYAEPGKPFSLDSLYLRPSGVIRGNLSETFMASEVGAVYVPGTSSFASLSSMGETFVLSQVPSGIRDLRIRSTFNLDRSCYDCVDPNDTAVEDFINIAPGDTIQVRDGILDAVLNLEFKKKDKE